ncbi:MAG: TIGR02757 family protein, partial [Mucinivorans sp.]
EYLDELCTKYNCSNFIAEDPISVPHLYEQQQDIEIAAFLSATIAWGKRTIIVRNAHKITELMGHHPYDFVMGASEEDLRALEGFVHRTFNHIDLQYFILSLRNIYTNHGGLGEFFQSSYLKHNDIRPVLSDFYKLFFEQHVLPRTTRHISSIDKGAACKRLCMFLKWMVRKDLNGVDFGIWDKIPPSALYLPLDVHSGNTSRALGLLTRKQSDWKAVEEVTTRLREFDPRDPVRYDFALFCAGIEGLLPR